MNDIKFSNLSWDAIKARKARTSLLDFTTYTFPKYQVNWHHKIVCEYLEKWVSGEITRLMIFSPPRSGKSELVSRRLPAWIFGKYPDSNIIASSYNMDLASKMNRDVQRIIDTPEYRNVFPDTSLAGRSVRTVTTGNSYLRNTEVFEIVGHKGVYKASGVGTGITGHGFDFGLIDDPVKDRKEAESKAVQEGTWDWYRSVFYTRRMGDTSRILLTLTRWGTQDLAGKLLELSKTDPSADQWTVLSLPMIAEDPVHPEDPRKVGDPLWPERFSMESLLATRAVMGQYDWAALMQQNPVESGGTVFNRGWWTEKMYDDDPRFLVQNMEEVIQSWDMTYKEGAKSDFVVGQVWGRRGADKYLLDQVRFQGDFNRTIKEFRILSDKWPTASRKLVEEAANGYAVISSLKHEIPGILPVKPLGGKIVRAQAVAPQVEAGNVYLPSPKYAPWIHDFLDEVCMFPNVKNDDQVDSMTMCISNMLIRGTPIKPPTIPKKIVSVGSGVNNLFSGGRNQRRRSRIEVPG